MKILILTNSLSGLFSFRIELVQKLLSFCDVIISAPFDGGEEDFAKIGCELINTSLELRGKNPIHDIILLSNYKKILNKYRPNYVLSYTIKPNIYGGIACKKMKIPFIANITGLGTAVENKGILQFITIIMYRFALKNAKMVFFQNLENQRFMISRKMVRNN